MSDVRGPIYTRPKDLKSILEDMQSIGLSSRRVFVGTPDHPSDAVLRDLHGGIIPGIRSLHDSLDKLEQAIASGAPGLDLASLSKIVST